MLWSSHFVAGMLCVKESQLFSGRLTPRVYPRSREQSYLMHIEAAQIDSGGVLKQGHVEMGGKSGEGNSEEFQGRERDGFD